MAAQAALWGLVGASALVVAAEVAFAFNLSSKVIGLIMAFGVGALISSIAFELVVPSLETANTTQAALGLLAVVILPQRGRQEVCSTLQKVLVRHGETLQASRR